MYNLSVYPGVSDNKIAVLQVMTGSVMTLN